ncbi:hypothetical protein [Microbulbifer sp. JMSA002]|uniref:hypothetical protein n=1 Tax=Microbulbifer sp. JMSA002 TaxID=3243368 RepID=UPI00403906C1
MAFLETKDEIQACLNTIDITADAVDPRFRHILKVQINTLDAATNNLIDDLNALTEKQERLRELLK